ncbi:alpha/beta fold hydrolase [Terriglobus sp. TAA 43]|uniref:alpha/beta fold hydrolase n=1 Tax=Terriglobus sp. TAA 43 TaxID=278961 RepID=UPI00068C7EF1|nr:alpha/beta hydrolase [Terriglobus sp. TAA 43]
MTTVRHSTLKVGQVTVFYREAGVPGNPVLLLLHGFANSSHYFRHLMPLLANRFHLIAPDLPSFGFTEVEGDSYRYTFAQLTQTIQAFVGAMGLRRFAIYVFDYGAPIGFNLAVADPSRISGIISQNGNAYEEGLGEGPWAPLHAYWKQPSAAIRDQIKGRMSLDGVREAYFHGVADVAIIEPEAYWLDAALLARPGMMERQVDLKLDYKANIERYPLYQQYFRTHQPPLLAIWGKNDNFFIPPGAEAFKRDVPNAVVKFVDAGHFALETNLEEIALAILAMPM